MSGMVATSLRRPSFSCQTSVIGPPRCTVANAERPSGAGVSAAHRSPGSFGRRLSRIASRQLGGMATGQKSASGGAVTSVAGGASAVAGGDDAACGSPGVHAASRVAARAAARATAREPILARGKGFMAADARSRWRCPMPCRRDRRPAVTTAVRPDLVIDVRRRPRLPGPSAAGQTGMVRRRRRSARHHW
jgi:hypothetical protein